ncbi:MAG: hypothetical protein AAF570_11330, partial [Bacteroidota bacterium]
MAPEDNVCEQPVEEVCETGPIDQYVELIANAEANEETAKKLYNLGDDMGIVMVELMRNNKYDVIESLWDYVFWWDTDWVSRELMKVVTLDDLIMAPDSFLLKLYNSMKGGNQTVQETAFMLIVAEAARQKSLLKPEDLVCEDETEPVVEEDKFNPDDIKEASEYHSDSKAKSLYGKRQHSDLGTLKKKEATKGTVSYGYQGAKFDNEEDYYKAVDEKYKDREGDDEDKLTQNQKDLLEIARKAATDDSYFNDVVNSSEAAKNAKFDFSNSMLENDAFTFSSVLKSRMERYHKFMVAVGLYTAQTIKTGGQSALRDRPVAHKWSVEYYMMTEKDKDPMLDNLKMMYDNPSTYVEGDKVVDKENKNPWARKSDFVDKDG